MGIQACMILIYNDIYIYIEIWGYKILCFGGGMCWFLTKGRKRMNGLKKNSGYSQIWSNSGFLEMESISCQRIFLSQFWYTWDLVDMFWLLVNPAFSEGSDGAVVFILTGSCKPGRHLQCIYKEFNKDWCTRQGMNSTRESTSFWLKILYLHRFVITGSF